MNKPTVILDMPEAEYHARPEVSAHQLMKMLECPAKFRDYVDHPPEPTPAMIFGSRFHTALLEPLRYGNETCVMPDGMIRRGKAWDEFSSANAGKDIIMADDATAIAGMKASCMAHPDIARAVSDSKHEVSIFWIDRETGVEMRARIDMVRFRDNSGIINEDELQNIHLDDFKATDNASEAECLYAIKKYHYYIQAAVYNDGFAAVKKLDPDDENLWFSFIFCEKSSPYLCARRTVPHSHIKLARNRYRAALKLFKQCKQTNEWPSYYSGMLPEPTAWELKE